MLHVLVFVAMALAFATFVGLSRLENPLWSRLILWVVVAPVFFPALMTWATNMDRGKGIQWAAIAGSGVGSTVGSLLKRKPEVSDDESDQKLVPAATPPIPGQELDTLDRVVLEAMEYAESGKVRQGYETLRMNLERVEEELREELWVDQLICMYRGALVCFARHWGPE